VARGWESKSIEQQQEEARSAPPPKRPLTPEQREAESRKAGLELSRNRILAQMRAATNPRYQKTLEQALAAIEEQLNQLPRS
jgi:hypothetical protein